MLRLQPYEYKVIHLPGKNNIADPLSKLLKVDMVQQSEFSKMAEEHVRFVAINSTTPQGDDYSRGGASVKQWCGTTAVTRVY